MEDSFLYIDKIKNKNDDILAEKELVGKFSIKHYSGINTDNWVINKYVNGIKYGMSFSFFKLNKTQYVNINGEHIIEYSKFTCIEHVSNGHECAIIKNVYVGDIILQKCDVDIVKKALEIMIKYITPKRTSKFIEFFTFIMGF